MCGEVCFDGGADGAFEEASGEVWECDGGVVSLGEVCWVAALLLCSEICLCCIDTAVVSVVSVLPHFTNGTTSSA